MCRLIYTRMANIRYYICFWVDPKQALSIESSYFDPLAKAIVWEKIFKSKSGFGPADQRVVKSSLEELDTVLQGYERSRCLFLKSWMVNRSTHPVTLWRHSWYIRVFFNELTSFSMIVNWRIFTVAQSKQKLIPMYFGQSSDLREAPSMCQVQSTIADLNYNAHQ